MFSFQEINANQYQEQLYFNVDGKIYDINTSLSISDITPSFNLIIKYPNGNDIKLETSLTHLGEKKYKGKLIIENFGDFNLLSDCDINFENIESFYLILNVNAPKINFNKIHIELIGKKNLIGGTKGIEFKASSSDKNILSGFADYTIKEEKGKTIIEGTGNVKLYEKEKLASFKFVRNNFEEGRDETGSHVSNSTLFICFFFYIFFV